jgi:hypothetical protein
MSWSQFSYFPDHGSPPPTGGFKHFAVSRNWKFSIGKRKTDSFFVASMFYNFLLGIYFNEGISLSRVLKKWLSKNNAWKDF